jgi:hypothetical protein
MRAAFRPLHLLAFGKALADDGVHRGFRQARGDAFTRTESLAVIDQAADVGRNINGEFLEGAGKFPEIGAVDFKGVHVVLEYFDGLSRTVLVAVPKEPLDPFQAGKQALARGRVMVGDATRLLAKHR